MMGSLLPTDGKKIILIAFETLDATHASALEFLNAAGGRNSTAASGVWRSNRNILLSLGYAFLL